VTGCRGCLGRLVSLVLLAWAIGTLAHLLGWSDPTTGGIFLVVLGLLAVRGSRRGRMSGAARVTKVVLAPSIVRDHRRATGSGRRWDGSRSQYPSRPGHTLAPGGVHRARDPLPAQLRFRILQRDSFRCRYCGRPGSTLGVVLHVDHVVPVSAGGATREDNLRTACEECNLGKAARPVVATRSA
jgi:5-methylcytosine-specific restriction endonuclease McrA